MTSGNVALNLILKTTSWPASIGRGNATSITVLSSALPSSGEMNLICFVRSPMPIDLQRSDFAGAGALGVPTVFEGAGAEIAVAVGFADPCRLRLKSVEVEMKRKVVERAAR